MKYKRVFGILYVLLFVVFAVAGYAISDIDEAHTLIEQNTLDTPRLTDLLVAYAEAIDTNNTQEIQLAEKELFQYIQKTVELQTEHAVLSASVTAVELDETYDTNLMKIHQFLVLGDIESAEPLLDVLREDIKKVLLPEFEKYQLLFEEQQNWYITQNISLVIFEQEKKLFENAYAFGDVISVRTYAKKAEDIANQSLRYTQFVEQADQALLENTLLNERKDELFYAFSQRDDTELSSIVDVYFSSYDEVHAMFSEKKTLEQKFNEESPYLSVPLRRSLNNTLAEGKQALAKGDLEKAQTSFSYVSKQVDGSREQRAFTTILTQESNQLNKEANGLWYVLLSLKLLLFASIIIFEKNLLAYELKRLERTKKGLGDRLKSLQKSHFQKKTLGKESFDTQTKIIQENLFTIYEKIAYVTYHKNQLEKRRRK